MAHKTADDTWLTDQLFAFDISKQSRDHFASYPYPTWPPYVEHCFLTIQNKIERALINNIANQTAPAITFQRYPYPKVIEDTFIVFASKIFPILLVICMMVSVKNIIKVRFAGEHENWKNNHHFYF